MGGGLAGAVVVVVVVVGVVVGGGGRWWWLVIVTGPGGRRGTFSSSIAAKSASAAVSTGDDYGLLRVFYGYIKDIYGSLRVYCGPITVPSRHSKTVGTACSEVAASPPMPQSPDWEPGWEVDRECPPVVASSAPLTVSSGAGAGAGAASRGGVSRYNT